MSDNSPFDLRDFLPYALNQAAEATSRAFQQYYKGKYGMLRTEWRVLFHLGRHGSLTAKEICERGSIHKTKVSRAVAALEQKRLLSRKTLPDDRRHEILQLTKNGSAVFTDLCASARAYDAELAGQFTAEEQVVLRRCLSRIAAL